MALPYSFGKLIFFRIDFLHLLSLSILPGFILFSFRLVVVQVKLEQASFLKFHFDMQTHNLK